MDLSHWERFEPRIGPNHSLPPGERFFLEVACGLSKVQLKAVIRALDFSKLPLDVKAIAADVQTAKADDETAAEALQRLTEERMAALCVEQLAREWSPFVRVGAPGHTFGEKPIATLKDYLEAIIQQAGQFNVIELSKIIAQLNSVNGVQALFFERLSGGPISTVAPRTDAVDAATAGR